MLNRCILPLLLIAGLALGAIPAATAAPVAATPTGSFIQLPGVAPRPSNLPGLESSEGASSSGAETIESQIVTILENDPKATRLSENQVTWRADNVVLTLTDDSTTAAGSWCGTGYVCVFSDINRTGYGYAFTTAVYIDSLCTDSRRTITVGFHPGSTTRQAERRSSSRIQPVRSA